MGQWVMNEKSFKIVKVMRFYSVIAFFPGCICPYVAYAINGFLVHEVTALSISLITLLTPIGFVFVAWALLPFVAAPDSQQIEMLLEYRRIFTVFAILFISRMGLIPRSLLRDCEFAVDTP